MAPQLHSKITINGKQYQAGEQIAWYAIYPFFLLHMLMFGASGFYMAYGADDVPLLFIFLHGGIAILVYTLFYFAIFGVDEVKWMVINAGLGIFGIIAQLSWILGLLFNREMGDYSIARHIVPFCYYVLYTFLLHQALLDASGARTDESRRRTIDNLYILLSVLIYAAIFL